MAIDVQWAADLVAASATASPRPGLDARVAVTVGSESPVLLDIRDGRIVDATAAEAGRTDVDVEVPLSPEVFEAAATGELSLAVAYMRGDVKPVGSTGALAVFLEVVEDPTTWAAWRS